jgi:hypothetical protein
MINSHACSQNIYDPYQILTFIVETIKHLSALTQIFLIISIGICMHDNSSLPDTQTKTVHSQQILK